MRVRARRLTLAFGGFVTKRNQKRSGSGCAHIEKKEESCVHGMLHGLVPVVESNGAVMRVASLRVRMKVG